MKNSIGRDIPEEILNTYHKKAYGEKIESKSVLLQKKAYNNNHFVNKVKENLQILYQSYTQLSSIYFQV